MPITNLRSLAVQRTPLRELNLNMLLGGPVLALPCQEGSGQTVSDISGFGNDGSFKGVGEPAWRQLSSGLWCLDFDGTDDGVEVADAASLDFGATTDFTLLAWINLTDVTAHRYIFNKGDVPNNKYFHFRVNPTTGVLWSALRSAALENAEGAAATDVSDGVWHLVGVVFDRSANFQHYLDGIADGNAVDISGIGDIDTNDALGIGKRLSTTWGLCFKGSIALPRIYNRALSALEIQNHFNQEKHLFGRGDANSVLARLNQQRQLAVTR